MAETPTLKAAVMTPADFRDYRAKRWHQAWAGEDVRGTPLKIPQAVLPDLTTRVGVLDALQRLADWYNAGGVSGSGVVFAVEALLQRAGRKQTPPCCLCDGTGRILRIDEFSITPRGIEPGGVWEPCPEGGAYPVPVGV